jgi:hypothetical protein
MELPEQDGLDPELIAMFTEGIRTLLTDMVIPEEVTVEVPAHEALEVSLQLIISPSFKVLLVNTEFISPPIGDPFSNH